jgi:hypothetical protein
METIVVLIIAVAFAFIPASMAKKKGYSYGGFWVFGFFFWLIAVIVAACLKDKTREQAQYMPQQPYYAPPVSPPLYSPATAPPPQAQSKPQALPEKYCPYCGNKYAGDKATCDSCGARI